MTSPTSHTNDTSKTYTSLKQTALSFITAQSYHPHLPTKMDFPTLSSLLASSYTHSFGPAHAVSQAPKLQETFSADGFIQHLQGMVGSFSSWEVQVVGVVVDEVGRSVVVRVRYGIFVGGEETVNEVVWWLDMEEEEGGGWKVGRSLEMLDAVAAGRIRELMVKGQGKDSAAE